MRPSDLAKRPSPFDAEDFWDYSAIALTLQTGAPIVNIHVWLLAQEVKEVGRCGELQSVEQGEDLLFQDVPAPVAG